MLQRSSSLPGPIPSNNIAYRSGRGLNQQTQSEVDSLDGDEGQQQTAQAIDRQIAAQQRIRARRADAHPAQGKGNQQGDHQGIEDDRSQDGAHAERSHLTVGA